MGKKYDKRPTKKTFEEFQREEFLKNAIQEKLNGYKEEDLNDQINLLKITIEDIKAEKESGKTLEEIEEILNKYLSRTFSEIEQPILNDFFRLITFDRMIKGQKIDISARVKALIESKIDIYDVGNRVYEDDNTYTGNLEKNIDIFLCELISELTTYEYSISEKFNNMRSKIKQGDLTVSDAPLLAEFVKSMIEHISIGRAEECQRILKNDINELYSRLINNMDKFFEFHEETIVHTANTPDLEKAQIPMEELKIPSNSINLKETGLLAKSKTTRYVTLKKCIQNPFISKDKKNNMDIYLYILLKSYTDNTEFFNYFYNLLIGSKNNDKIKQHIKDIIRRDLKFKHSSMHVRELLGKRINILMELYEKSGKIDWYNKLNNKRLSDKRLERLAIDTAQLLDILKSVDKENTISTEAIIAISAFYANRLTKIWPMYARAKFILDKKNAIESIYNNTNLTYEDLDFSDEEIKLYMAQYDTLQQILQENYISKLSDSEIYKLEFDEETREKGKQLYVNSLKPYGKIYNELYGSFNQDTENVSRNCEIPRKFYSLKKASIKSLIYTALTDKKNNIINWGYVPFEENGDNKFVLLGFDIKYLNMPVFFHIKERDLLKFVEELTGDTKLPVYEGKIDMYDFSGNKRITTLVLYPLPKSIRKNLELTSQDKARALPQHLRWLQKPKEKPVFIGKPGSKIYDLKTKKIIKNKTKNDPEDPGSPGL